MIELSLDKTESLTDYLDHLHREGYETFDEWVQRTGFPRDRVSYAAYINEGNWMITQGDNPV